MPKSSLAAILRAFLLLLVRLLLMLFRLWTSAGGARGFTKIGCSPEETCSRVEEGLLDSLRHHHPGYYIFWGVEERMLQMIRSVIEKESRAGAWRYRRCREELAAAGPFKKRRCDA